MVTQTMSDVMLGASVCMTSVILVRCRKSTCILQLSQGAKRIPQRFSDVHNSLFQEIACYLCLVLVPPTQTHRFSETNSNRRTAENFDFAMTVPKQVISFAAQRKIYNSDNNIVRCATMESALTHRQIFLCFSNFSHNSSFQVRGLP